jgi:hypothetical protein
VFLVFRLADRPWELSDTGAGCLDGLQLLAAGVGGAAGLRPRGVPGGQGRRGAGRSSMVSRLRALSRNVTQHMRRTLHLGV